MKIDRIRTVLCYGGRQNWVFVLVDTDEGLTGIGEASIEGKEKAVEAAVHEMSRFILGCDPLRIEQNWQSLYRHGFWRGGVVLNSAISGIDQALWDISGKVLGVPAYRLLGGAARDKMQLYCHAGRGSTDAEAAAHAKLAIDAGWRALKAPVAGFEQFASEAACIDAAVSRLGAIREAVGKDVLLMTDAHGRHRPGQAIKLLRALEPLDMYFVEEPVPPDDPKAYARLAEAHTNVTIATGERLFSKWDYRELFENQYVDIIQPDICHCGGITELRKVANMAETYYMRVAPHNPNGPVATMASLHLAATLPNFTVLEYAGQQFEADGSVTRVHDPFVQNPLEVVDGYVALPTAPGLGVELNMDAVAESPYRPVRYERAFSADGAVSDI